MKITDKQRIDWLRYNAVIDFYKSEDDKYYPVDDLRKRIDAEINRQKKVRK